MGKGDFSRIKTTFFQVLRVSHLINIPSIKLLGYAQTATLHKSTERLATEHSFVYIM